MVIQYLDFLQDCKMLHTHTKFESEIGQISFLKCDEYRHATQFWLQFLLVGTKAENQMNVMPKATDAMQHRV